MKWTELWFIKELKSPLRMATSSSNRQCYWLLPTAAQIASSTGAFNCKKAALLQRFLLHVVWAKQSPTLNSLVKLASPSPAKCHWSWRHHCQVSRRDGTHQYELRFACALRKKEHHTGITLETDPFRKNVSKSNPMQEICMFYSLVSCFKNLSMMTICVFLLLLVPINCMFDCFIIVNWVRFQYICVMRYLFDFNILLFN